MAFIPKLLARPHVFFYRMTGGVLGGRIVGCPVLLLTTTGRRSSRYVTVPLLYVEDGETPAIMASYGGSPAHPAWYLNLQEDPRCDVQIKRWRTQMIAEVVEGSAREVLWNRAVSMYGPYADYQHKTARRIPVIRLRPG